MTPSITNQPVFKPETNRIVYMEDIRSMKLALLDAMEAKGIKIKAGEEDKFWDSLSLFLEESFNWPDYASYN